MADEEINTTGFNSFKSANKTNWKVISALIGITVLTLGIVAGTLLIKQQQDIREKASEPTMSPTTTISSFAGTPSCGQIKYTWGAISGATGYYVDISQDVNFSQFISSGRLSPSTTTFTFTGLENGKSYYARITLTDIPNFPQYTITGPNTTLVNCPSSAPSKPTITTSCSSGQPVASITWTGTPANFGFWVDISEISDFSSFYNKQVSNGLSTDSTNFHLFKGVDINNSGEPQLVLQANKKYYSRVFNSFESETAEFTTCSPAGEPNACGGTCGSNSNCAANLVCSQGFCRNPSCVSSTNCVCNTVSFVTSTPSPKASATSSSIFQKTNSPTATAFPIPETGTSWPTILGTTFGIIVILASFMLFI